MVSQKYDLLLEVGCGKGYWSEVLKQAGVNVVAQDLVQSETNAATDQTTSFIQDAIIAPVTAELFAPITKNSALLMCWVPCLPIQGFIDSVHNYRSLVRS